VTSTDAALLAKRGAGSAAEQNRFDAILLDAPCSSERHVLASEYHLAQWTPARIRNLCVAQWALLSAAFRLLKTGGVLTYATCALHPDENDGTVQKLLKKFPGAKIVPPQKIPEAASAHFEGALPESEQTDTGRLRLPDTSNGAGPLFFSCVKKESE
jgi:16S rRNA C967 or C1407 C5-methylase (RsmB/RsmF family)